MLLFSTDIDGTIYDGPESAQIFSDFWANGKGERLLVYNTGRSLEDTRHLISLAGLPAPDYLICGVGTVIYDWNQSTVLDEFRVQIGKEWNFDVVREVVQSQTAARPQPPECQNANKCSWFWEDASPIVIQAVVEEIGNHGVKAQAVYSSNRDLDFLPVRADKGNGVQWLATHLGIETEDIVVAGDSGNDAKMYAVPGVKCIVVANAEQALVESVQKLAPYFAAQKCVAGVIEGLQKLRGDIFANG